MSTPLPMQQPMPSVPWWRVRMVWPVIAGPSVMVLASIASSVIAWTGADPVVSAPPVAQTRDAAALSTAPALQARNHTAAAH